MVFKYTLICFINICSPNDIISASQKLKMEVSSPFWPQTVLPANHDDVIKWKHFPRYWSFVRGIHRSPVNSPHKGQWRGALMCSLISIWINSWVNNRKAGDLRRYRVHYDVIVLHWACWWSNSRASSANIITQDMKNARYIMGQLSWHNHSIKFNEIS